MRWLEINYEIVFEKSKRLTNLDSDLKNCKFINRRLTLCCCNKKLYWKKLSKIYGFNKKKLCKRRRLYQ